MKFTYKTGSQPLDGYTIKRGVGIGGFGEVYFALSDAGKEVALKRIQRNLDVEVRGVTQCLNLKHPNLVALFDLKYDDQGQAWVVMEYVAGESLGDVIDRNPNGMPTDQVQRWFRELAAGVAYLHDSGIVHRDLKPGNLFEDDGHVKIGDYGLSKFIATSRRSGQTDSVGTFHYMAPEIGKGVYGKEVDIYAMGVILFEMLTGDVPFDGETSQEIIMKHLTDSPDLSHVPAAYHAAIQKALRKDPEKRFRSVPEMLAALPGNPVGESSAPDLRLAAEQPMYIGEPTRGTEASDIVFGPVKYHEVVAAEAVPPVRRPITNTSAHGRSHHPAAHRQRHAPTACPTGQGMTGAGKTVLLLTIGLLLWFQPWLLPVAIVIGVIYVPYAICRAAWRCACGATAVAGQSFSRSDSDAIVMVAARERLRRKPFSEQAAELTGSMLLATAVAATLCFVFLLLSGDGFDGSTASWTLYAWLTLCSVAASWLLLGLGKLWEGRDEDQFRRRFTLLVVGLGVGVITFAASRVLMVDLPDYDNWTAHMFTDGRWMNMFYAADGSPLVATYLLYFAGLFVILRWWTQTDPLRASRLSLWATAMCVLWAWVIHMPCRFPQPWGLVLAATISVTVQLASPWISPRQLAEIGARKIQRA